MRKVLCPNCKKIVRFEEGGVLCCPSCSTNLKVTVFQNEIKNIVTEFEPSDNIFYCGDEIIRVEIAKINEEKSTDIKEDINDVEINKENIKEAEQADSQTADKKIIADKKEPNKQSTTINEVDSKKTVEYCESEIECESEIIEKSVLAKEEKQETRKLKKVKDKRQKPLRYYAVMILAGVAFVAMLIMLYAPTFEITLADGEKIERCAQFIGIAVGGEILQNQTATKLASACGWVMLAVATFVFLYGISALRAYGGYDKRRLVKSVVLGGALGALALTEGVLQLVLHKNLGIGCAGGFAVLSTASCFVIVATWVVNLALLLGYKPNKKIVVSPKTTEKRAVFMLGVAIFFICEIFAQVLFTGGGKIAYGIVANAASGGAPMLAKLSLLSDGIFGNLLMLVFTKSGQIAISGGSKFLTSLYVDLALGALLTTLVVVYIFYISRTKDIFLGRVRGEDEAKRFQDDEYEQKKLAKFLKKNTSFLLMLFAMVFTLQLASDILKFLGSGKPLVAVLVMLSSVAVLGLRCFPYAMLAREEYMQAFYDFNDMGAELPPITVKQKRAILIVPIAAIVGLYSIFSMIVFLL